MMNEKTKKNIIKAVQIVLSVILCIVSVISMLFATLINVGRDYADSDELKTQIYETDLSTVTFLYNGQKYTVIDYIKMCIKDYIGTKSKFSNMIIDFSVENTVDSDAINKLVKDEAIKAADYFIHSDVKEAKMRLKNNIDPIAENNKKLEESKSFKETASIYIHSYILSGVQKALNMPSDKLIVLLSENTYKAFVAASVISLIVLLILNYNSVFNLFLYGSGISFIYGAVIKYAQNKFFTMNENMQDLVGYVFAKPLVECYSQNATGAFIAGAILIVIFALLFFFVYKFMNKQSEEANTVNKEN